MAPKRPSTPGFDAATTAPAPPEPPKAAPVEISVESARELDRRCAEEFHIPTIILMEHASLALRDRVRAILDRSEQTGPVWVFCGSGNNGGDGLALARHLHNAQTEVLVVLVDPDHTPKGDAATQLKIVHALGVPIVTLGDLPEELPSVRTPTLVVDAVLGTGLTSAPRPAAANAIERIHALHKLDIPVLSVDVPSGLDARSGEVLGERAVAADTTVTFVAPKTGFSSITAQRHLGEVVVAPIGAPRALVEALTTPVESPKGR